MCKSLAAMYEHANCKGQNNELHIYLKSFINSFMGQVNLLLLISMYIFHLKLFINTFIHSGVLTKSNTRFSPISNLTIQPHLMFSIWFLFTLTKYGNSLWPLTDIWNQVKFEWNAEMFYCHLHRQYVVIKDILCKSKILEKFGKSMLILCQWNKSNLIDR